MINKKLISGPWYHGDRQKISTFTGRYMDAEDFAHDRNAMGPGIYWTRLKWQASGYAEKEGYVYTAEMDLEPDRVMTIKTKPDAAKLRKFIELAPNKESRDMSLQNYAEDIDAAIELAIEYAMDEDNMLDAAMGLYNDLYSRKQSAAFGESMTAIGYDAYLHKLPEVYHLIVYNPEIIKVKEVVKKMKHIKGPDEL